MSYSLPSFSSMRAAFLVEESAALEPLLASATLPPSINQGVDRIARDLVTAVRGRQRDHAGMQSFLTQYDLSTQEGVLLMCVAEALLRIPDAATADKLIKDKFQQGDWKKHLGASDSLLVNAGTWGMMLTGKLVAPNVEGIADVGGWLTKLAGRVGEPIVRASLKQGMKLMAEQFVMGRTIGDALARAAEGDQAPYRHSYDMLGEAAMTAEDAERYFKAYQDAIAAISKAVKPGQDVFTAPGISIKLSALHPRYELAQRHRVLNEMLPKVKELALLAMKGGIGLTLDAEETERLEISLELLAAVFGDPAFDGYEGLGLAVQAYQKRAPHVIDWLIELSRAKKRRLMTRLVKGAYWDTEIKRAQMQGFTGYPVFTRKVNTDVSYLACAAKMLAHPEVFYPQFATHNAHTVATVLERAGKNAQYEFQRLHGMGMELYEEVLKRDGTACRVYAPVGSHEDLLPYLVRRLLENGANSSFVNRIADPDVSIDDVVADPVAVCHAQVSKQNLKLPLPQKLFAAADVVRDNSLGFSFAEVEATEALYAGMRDTLARKDLVAKPLIAGDAMAGKAIDAVSPVTGEKIGVVEEADAALTELAVSIARGWRGMPGEARADVLDRAAALLESKRAFFMALCVREAGKTLPDALGEVREAIDFCRYYAAMARAHFAHPHRLPGPTGESNDLYLQGRGVFVSISPWNFPLAIFLGQVTAAFAAGNAVVAKPAEQTPIIAFEAVKLLLEAGMPKEAIALLPGRGEIVGARLTADARIAGVAFTGGTDTAQRINRTLAQRPGPIVPFIAETGGLNAMIADSSALPEQVVNDVVASAFNSAGQRCSALRILCVQKDIAPRIETLLAGAMRELKLGDPSRLDTDIGPAIDGEALAMLKAHREKMASQFRLIGETPMPRDIPGGTFFAPCAFAIPAFDTIKSEVFGPILHVVAFEAHELMDLVDRINASGYGLTLGIHSRIEETIEAIRQRARVGNVYVNRNQIGAVVGVQPFGGEGLSGTGPKAGGPHYLFRFASERTFTVNTAAAGGNAALIASSE
ncbi:MAG: bifunctional proline dehydrogenase/L-glutamate gamma-semialdehyde dehydrogenase PutA [Betaproteobacteria bacterium]|nr:bifunctional proline dehydrogenase/L-glutamate gamma-semialdehyde dehydrogenase PutA [Betaproteobacteria bacterium]